MKKKIAFILTSVVIAVIVIACSVSTEVEKNVENIVEIQPEEEISEEQMRQTKVKLFFADNTSGVLAIEERNIDSKELIDSPYKFVINLLIAGPKQDNLKSVIPEGTKLNSVKFEKGILYVDLTSEFLNGNGTDSIYSIVNTLTEFTEVNGIKFTIDGEIEDSMKDTFLRK